MCKFIGKCNEWFFCKLSKSEILSLYSIVHVAMETTKKSHFTCQSKSFISIFFTCQVSACELQSFSCHDLANDIYSQTAKTVFSHLKFFLSSSWCLDALQNKGENYPRKCFWTKEKESRVKFNPGLSTTVIGLRTTWTWSAGSMCVKDLLKFSLCVCCSILDSFSCRKEKST